MIIHVDTQVAIHAVDMPTLNNNCHHYLIRDVTVPVDKDPDQLWAEVFFEKEGDGIREEDLLRILIHRVESRLGSSHKTRFDEQALTKLEEAMIWLGGGPR